MWLDFAEDRAKRRKQIFLKDWQQKLDQFLQFNDRNVLANHGSISRQQANEKAYIEFDVYSVQQKGIEESRVSKDIAELLQWSNKDKS